VLDFAILVVSYVLNLFCNYIWFRIMYKIKKNVYQKCSNIYGYKGFCNCCKGAKRKLYVHHCLTFERPLWQVVGGYRQLCLQLYCTTAWV